MSSGVGSRPYKAPEVLSGGKDYDGRADVWSAGIIALEMFLHYRPKFDPGKASYVLSSLRLKQIAL